MKGDSTQFQYTIIRRKETRILGKHNRVYVTELGWHLLPDPSSSCQVSSDSNLEPQLGKVPGRASTRQVRLQIGVLGASVYNSRPQIDIISLRAKMQLWIHFKKCCWFHHVSHKIFQTLGDWPGPQGSRNSKTHSLSYHKRRLTC